MKDRVHWTLALLTAHKPQDASKYLDELTADPHKPKSDVPNETTFMLEDPWFNTAGNAVMPDEVFQHMKPFLGIEDK